MAHYALIIEGKTNVQDSDLANIAVAFISTGVVGANDYLVTAQSSPNMSVQVATGRAYILNTAGTMNYASYNNATINVNIASNTSGSTQIDSIVLYPNLAVAVDANGDNVMQLADVRGSGGLAPTNAEILTAIGSSNPYTILANISVANNATSITSGNITDERAFAKITGGDTVYQSAMDNFVSSGITFPTSASLSTTSTSGVIYFNGTKVSVASDGGHTYTASQDTYVDISNTGAYAYNGVTNGASAPALTANSIRVAKVVSSASAITSVTQTGADSNGVLIYPTRPAASQNNPVIKGFYYYGNLGSNPTIDFSKGRYQVGIVNTSISTASSTSGIVFSNAMPGQIITLELVENGTGGFTIPTTAGSGLPSNVKWVNGVTPAWAQSANNINTLTVLYDYAGNYLLQSGTGYA